MMSRSAYYSSSGSIRPSSEDVQRMALGLRQPTRGVFATEKIVPNRAMIMLIRRGPTGSPLRVFRLGQLADEEIDIPAVHLVDSLPPR